MTVSGSRYFSLCCMLLIYLLVPAGHAAERDYRVDIDAEPEFAQLLRQHLEIVQAIDNPRLNQAEWRRLIQKTPDAIANIMATRGYFSPQIESQTEGRSDVRFTVASGPQSRISSVDIDFVGDIQQQAITEQPSIDRMLSDWQLEVNNPFTQAMWDEKKRKLLSTMVVLRYPNAQIRRSKAEVDPVRGSVKLTVTVDSGAARYFGDLHIDGLQRYPAKTIRNLSQIESGAPYSQADLLKLQSDLQATGYFSSVEVVADTSTPADLPIPVQVHVVENQAVQIGIGVGASTNTGARTQLTYDNLNLFERGWRLSSSLRVEQRAQSLNAGIALPTRAPGYRDSLTTAIAREDIEGQVLVTTGFGAKRSWGSSRLEQSIGTNYLIEHAHLDHAPSANKQAVTVAYGITLRRTDNDLLPTRGYLFNAQFTAAPLTSFSEGRFIRSYAKTQAYYPLTKNTQLMARLEFGAVSGAGNTPSTYLFRAGGDQSVRGYAYQSLGVASGDATVGGRYLLTGSLEAVQWFSAQWGAALFVDFGDAANRLNAIHPVYGYGLGARWKSPAGPLGADIAYGEDTGEYRLHFNLGVNF